MSKNKAILDALDNNLRAHPTISKEPEWMMSIKQGSKILTQSETKAVTKNASHELTLAHFCPIRDYRFGLSRGVKRESVTNDLVPNGLCAHELKVVASFASINSAIHASFAHNEVIDTVTISRLIAITPDSAGGSTETNGLKSVSTYTFEHLYITGLVSKNDLICLSFRYLGIQYTKDSIHPKTGVSAGSNAASYHSLINLGEAASGG